MSGEAHTEVAAQDDQQTAASESATVLLTEAQKQGEVKDPANLIGETIAQKYVLLSYIGGGGMSYVYKARHLHIANRVVAVKVLRSAVKEEEILRLRQEANAVSKLSHENIIGLHDFGVAENKQPYLVMDFFEGRSLEEILNAGRIEPERISRIIAQVCSALYHAHERGVVHRDIKPGNILVGKDENESDIVKVVDFGIAKVMNAPVDTKLTRTGDVLGSPLYMSPEQCLGQSVDERSDIYSLGCVMYEALTGNAPFRGENTFETIYKQIHERPAPFAPELSRTSSQKLRQAIVLKMMAKDPNERYRYMIEVASELKQAENPEHSSLNELGVMWQLWRARLYARTRRGLALERSLRLASVAAVMVALGIAILPTQIEGLRRESDRYDWICNNVKNSLIELNLKDGVVHDILQRGDIPVTPRAEQERIKIHAAHVKANRLMQNDRKALNLLRELRSSQHAAFEKTMQFKQLYAERLPKLIFSGAGDLDKAEVDQEFLRLVGKWTPVIDAQNQLYGHCVARLRELSALKSNLVLLYQGCQIMSTMLLVLLPLLLFLYRRRKKVEQDAEYHQSQA